MFGKQVTVFKLLGFPIRIDVSWLIVVALITWTLAEGVFPAEYSGLSATTRWVMGIAAALGLFLSIIIHELCHSLVAQQYGLPMKGITLFIFGGVAEMSDQPPSPKAEFLMAIAGPLASLAIAGSFYAASMIPSPFYVGGVLKYLGFINLVLVAFNMIPGFPLDGGRVLRSALWAWNGNLQKATRVAARIGSGFGVFLMMLGVLSLITGNVFGGVWWFMIGLFIRYAAKQSYQQIVIREALAGEPIQKFMNDNPVTVPVDASVQELVDDYVYKYHYKMFPVMDHDRLVGCITTSQLSNIPRSQWRTETVGQAAQTCADETAVSPTTDALDALAIMNRTQASRLMVIENGRLEGIVTLKDLLRFLSLKMELQGHKAEVEIPSDVKAD